MPARRGARTYQMPAVKARRPTINDVARLANVSKKTVSRVINASPLVHQETRRKINAAINDLGFSPDPQARGLASRRSFLVGLICADPLLPNVVELQQGILDALRGTSFELVIRSADRQNPRFLSDMRAFVEGQRLFGVLLAPALSNELRLSELMRTLSCRCARIDGNALEAASLRDLAFLATANLIG